MEGGRRFVLFSVTDLGLELGQGFRTAGHDCELVVGLAPDLMPDNPASPGLWAADRGIEYQSTRDINDHVLLDELRTVGADFAVVSWPRMLRPEVLAIFPMGVVGSHPSPLPWGKGRHPLHWQVSMGMDDYWLSVFLLDEGVDTGPILLQREVRTARGSDINEVTRRVNEAARECGASLGRDLASSGRMPSGYRKRDVGSTWRRRTPADIIVDFRMTVDSIRNLAASYCSPFPCAKVLHENGELAVGSASRSPIGEPWEYFEVGYVFRSTPSQIDVRAADGIVTLNLVGGPMGIRAGDKLHPPIYYR